MIGEEELSASFLPLRTLFPQFLFARVPVEESGIYYDSGFRGGDDGLLLKHNLVILSGPAVSRYAL